jgi:hypothetical protein
MPCASLLRLNVSPRRSWINWTNVSVDTGWGFQAWAGGDSTKPIATDTVKQCFNCHVPQKAQDFTFSKYLE